MSATLSASRPRIGDVRYVVTWIDRDAMRLSDGEDDLIERLEVAERSRGFATMRAAKAWGKANADKDEYGNPRVEKLTFTQDDIDIPAYWIRSEYQEWTVGSWQPLVF